MNSVGSHCYTLTGHVSYDILCSIIIIPAALVSDIHAVAANATAVNVTWSKPDLLDWNVSSYTLYYKVFSRARNWVVDESSRVIPANTTSTIVIVSELGYRLEHQFRVTANLEVDGEIYEGEGATITFIFGKPRIRNLTL